VVGFEPERPARVLPVEAEAFQEGPVQRWQSIGERATSIRSLEEPWGSWQVVQFSRTGAWSQRNGPRFSAWQLVQNSLTVLPCLSSRTFVEPCWLWQVEHSSLPSRTGMCEERRILAASSRWHWAQVSVTEAILRWPVSDFGVWTLWQETQVMLRASCMLPCHWACSSRLWQPRQASLASRGAMALKLRRRFLAPTSSTWAWPAPWQVSHPRSAAGARGSQARA
jgi:hypothetical protein